MIATPFLLRLSSGLVVVAWVTFSCSGKAVQLGSCSAPATLHVSSGGVTLDARSATAHLRDCVVITAVPDECALTNAAEVLDAAFPADVTELRLFLNRATSPGMYSIDPMWVLHPTSVGAWLQHTADDWRVPDKIVVATSGTIEFTRVDTFDNTDSVRWTDVRIAGRYDVVFPDGAHAIGTFDTPYCRAQANACPIPSSL